MPAFRGEQHHAHKLTDDLVREIRAAYVPGHISQRTLAEQYGVAQSIIHLVLARRRWRHVK
ncbi:hypothetical protein GCM10027403_14470 [Arthrobacter tecti]